MNIYKLKSWLIVYLPLICVNELIQSTFIVTSSGLSSNDILSYKLSNSPSSYKANGGCVPKNNLNSVYSSRSYEDELHLITVNVKNTYATSKIKYIRNDFENTDTFIARHPYLIYSLKSGNRTIWESEDNKYGEEVIVTYREVGRPTVRINFVKGEDEYVYDANYIDSIDSGLISVNIKHKQSTNKVMYEMDYFNNAEIFTAIEPYLIARIVKGDRVVRTFEDSEYPYQIFYKKNPDNTSLVRVFFPDCQFQYKPQIRQKFIPDYRSRYKAQDERPICSKNSELITFTKLCVPEYPKYIKLLFNGSSNKDDTSKYSVFLIGDADDLYLFRFNKGEQCTELMYSMKVPYPYNSAVRTNDTTIWKYEVNDHTGYPVALYSHGLVKFVIIKFNDDLFYFYRKISSHVDWLLIKLGNVKSIDYSKIKVFTIGNRYGGLSELHFSLYDVYDLGFGYQFVFKSKAMCQKIVYNDENLYVYNAYHSGGKYPISVYVMSNKGCEVVYCDAGYYIHNS